jgi:calcium binding hemolysin protein, putative
LEIKIKDTDDKIILENLFDSMHGVEQFKFADGTIYKLKDIEKELSVIRGTEKDDKLGSFDSRSFTLEGYEGNDEIRGGFGDDILDGGTGNDSLYGGGGNDTYIFGRGYGIDTIYDDGGKLDTIEFKEGISMDDLEFVRISSDVGEIRIKNSEDKIVLKRIFSKMESVEQLKFSDGTICRLEDIRKEFATVNGTDKSDVLHAYDNIIGYTIYAGAGDDSIYGGKNNDIIYGQAGDDTIRSGAGDDLIYGGSGADTIIAEEGNDTLYGGSGNDQLYGREGNDILEGGEGNDILYGGAGDDTYIFGRGDGVDTIHDAVGGFDTIQFKEGIRKDDIEFVRTAHDEAELRIKGTDDKIILRKLFDSKEGVEQLQFFDGSIYKIEDFKEQLRVIKGSDKDESISAFNAEGYKIYAGAGNDSIYGGSGNDVIYGQAGDDFILAYEGNDTLYGGSGNDQLYGREGNDILEGGEGNDVLYGGDGDDTYIFGRGDGVDTIHDAVGGFDTIQFKEGISKDDIEFVRTAHDEAELRIKGTDDRIILRKLFNAKEGVEQLQFSDGSIYKLKDIREELATSIGSSNSDILYAYDNEVGNTVYAGDGRDAIYGSKKGDKLYGQEGDDYIEGGAGNDVLYGGAGNDSIYGQEGDDYLEGGAGNDYLNGGAGNDTYVFSKGDGKDTIYDQDSNPDNKDRIQLGYDILNTVFKRDGSNLCIGFADSTDTITINNWYSGSSYQIEEIKSSDNRSITNVQLQLMIDAMAAYTKDKGIDWNTAVKQNPNEVNSILQNFWVANSN